MKRPSTMFCRLKPERVYLRHIWQIACVALCMLAGCSFHSSRAGLVEPSALARVIETCVGFQTSFETAVPDSSSMPEEIANMLSFVDHIFVLSLESCATAVPDNIRRRSTCIKGKVLDSCAPSAFISGEYMHAMKVTFSHAIVLQLAREAEYVNIAVIEDDLSFISRKVSPQVSSEFSRLLESDSWNLVRFGFRPFFLQENGAKPCPEKCRCKLDPEFGNHLCRLTYAGCDIRSSDFFVLHSRTFALLQAHLLDRRVENSKRIIDVHPMRSIDNQWLFLPQMSYQKTLDIPTDYQIGAGALYVKKCAGPRPLPQRTTHQLFENPSFDTTITDGPPILGHGAM